MAQQTINTVIVLRNDQSTAWEKSDYVLLEGEVGICYLDGGKVMAKVGDGEHTWADLPQIESIIEDEITLTHNFGRYKTSNGSVTTTDAKGKSVSEWLIHALSEVLNPRTNYPTLSTAGGVYVEGASSTTTTCEIGSKITALRYDNIFNAGSYKDNANTGTYGTTTSATSNATGVAVKTWSVSNSIDSNTKSTEDGKFDLTTDKYITVDSESEKAYATVSTNATINLDNVRTPLNNIGKAYEAGKIKGWDTAGNTVKSTSADCKVTGYRKPFWGVKKATDTLLKMDSLTSADIRGLGNSGTSATGLPSTLSVAVGVQQVIFAAKAGAKSSLVAKDAAAMNATVSFTKVAEAVSVKGANDFAETKYDIWYVDFGSGLDAAMSLELTWA